NGHSWSPWAVICGSHPSATEACDNAAADRRFQNIVAAKWPAPSFHSPAVQHSGATVALPFIPRCPMTKISSLATVTALASFLLMGGVFAQTAAPAAKDATKTDPNAPAAQKEAKPRPAAS